jgi:hypothetical protein
VSTLEVLGAGWSAARVAARQRRAERVSAQGRARPGRLASALAEHGLTLLAGGCFTAAAVMVAVPLGLAVAGVALLVLELRVGD